MRAIVFIAVLSSSACGNWSNEDLEFFNAIPTREQLRVKLPVTASGGLTGEGTRRDGLAVGEPSKLYKDTRDAATSVNTGLLDFVIGVLDAVRSQLPTSRSKDQRVWGPIKDTANPGFEFRIVITRVDAENFGYAFQHRKVGGEFFNTVTGQFRATPSLRKGRGMLSIDTKRAAAELATAAGFKPFETIEIGYFTDTDPVRVEVMIAAIPGTTSTLSSVGYTYQERSDRSGQIVFAVKGVDANVTELNIVTRWLPAGPGRAEAKVTAGSYKDAVQIDCWDSAFNLTYASQNWPGGMIVGDEKTCVTVPGF